MRIYTRTGDDGTTGLFGGSRIGKDDLRIEAYGTLDELNAVLGRVGTHPSMAPWSDHLSRIQGDLFAMGSHLATTDPAFLDKLPALDPEGDAKLEAWMDEMEANLPALTTFVLPSGPSSAVDAHVARTVCRRAERRCVALNRAEPIDPLMLRHLNRLSDALFMLGRWLAQEDGEGDVPWLP